MRIFVSYRREDTGAQAGRLHDVLAAEFGERRIFQDVSGIEPGEDFVEAIETALATADVVLVVIGPSWLAPGPGGIPKLNDSGDYVRMEIAAALSSDLKVVPVLVGGGSLPGVDELPAELAPLTHRQALELRDDTWPMDVKRLIGSLRGEPFARRRSQWWTGMVGVAVVAVAAIVLISPDDGGEGGPPPVSCERPSEPAWTRFLGPEDDAAGTIQTPSGPVQVVVTDGFYRRVDEAGRWNVTVETVMENNSTGDVNNENWNYAQLEVNRFSFLDQSCFSTTHSVIGPGNRGGAIIGYEVTEDPAGSIRLVVEDGERVTIDLGS